MGMFTLSQSFLKVPKLVIFYKSKKEFSRYVDPPLKRVVLELEWETMMRKLKC